MQKVKKNDKIIIADSNATVEFVSWEIADNKDLKANELRFGNLVEWNKQPFKVCRIFSDSIENELWCKPINEIHPIPLTPEIMKNALNYKEGSYTNDLLRGYFVALHLDGRVYAEYYIGGYSVCKVEFLHQLQNLVFALTNEELPINLQP